MARPPDNRTLARWCRLWQKRLNIPEWKIEIRFADKENDQKILSEDANGCTYWQQDRQEAVILVNRTPDIPLEKVVIHELVHIVIDGHNPTSNNEVNNERAVIRLTDALCHAYRRSS